MELLNLFIFFIIFLLSYYSISGYGIIFNKYLLSTKDNKIAVTTDIISNFFTGIPLLIICGFLNYIFFGYNFIINFVCLLIGFVIFFLNVNIFKIFKISILPSCLFIGLLISKTHDDFVLYHFQYLKELSDNTLKFGLGNIDLRYGYSSLFSYLQGIFILPYYGLKFFHVPIYLIYVSLVNYLFFKTLETNNDKKFLVFFLQIFIMIKFKRLSEFGYDYIVQFLLIYLFVDFYTRSKNNIESFIVNLSIYLSALGIKIVGIFFLPVLFYFLFIKNFFYVKYLKTKTYFILLSAVFVIFLDSFLKTGCIHYTFVSTCLSNDIVSWAVDKNAIENNAKMISLWTKGFYHQGNERVEDIKLYLQNYNWIFNWIKVHFYKKVLNSIIIVFIIFISLYFFKKKKETYTFNNKFLIFSLLLSLVIWFLILPQFRFGFSIIILFTFFVLKNLFKKNIFIKKKQFILITVCLVVYFNFMNILRIKEEFSRNDEYKYIEFPFFPLNQKNYIISYNSENNEYFMPIQKELGSCFNLPTPCSVTDIDFKYYSIFYKKIIFIKKVNS
jgi:hypothetical protein